MSRGWTALVVLGSVALSVSVGALAGLSGRLLHDLIAAEDQRRRALGAATAALALLFVVAGVWKGVRWATRAVLPIEVLLAVAVGIAARLSRTGPGTACLELRIAGDRGRLPKGVKRDAARGPPSAHALPVLPKPPAPRAVGSSSEISALSTATRVTGATTSCAMRSPGRMRTASSPRLTSSTASSPR